MILVALVLANIVPITGVPDDETADQFLRVKDRWAVKTGQDQDAIAIDVSDSALSNASRVTIAATGSWVKPKAPKRASAADPIGLRRLQPYESTLFVIDGYLTDYILSKDDQDLHLVIRSSLEANSPSIIAEISDPSVIRKDAIWRRQIMTTRADFYQRMRPKSTFQKCQIRIRLTGPAFFDKIHGQTGVAANGVEIHPVLRLEWPGT